MNGFKEGDFVLFVYGSKLKEFYIAESFDDLVKVTMPTWLVSHGEFFTIEQLKARGARLLCHGKEKWFWRFLPWRDSIVKYKKVLRND